MLRHVFTLIWNKKRTHALLLVELVASFVVLFGVTSLVVYNVGNYVQPIGFSYENRWVIRLDWGTTPDSLVNPTLQQLKQRIRTYPEVKAVSLSSGNTPFSNSGSNGMFEYNSISVLANNYWVDTDFGRTLEIPLLEGRWFDATDEGAAIPAVVLTRTVKENLFGDGPAAGKVVVNQAKATDKKRIVGVIANYKKDGELSANDPGIFNLVGKSDWRNSLTFHVRPGTDATFEARLMRNLGQIAKGWNLELNYMDEQRGAKQSQTLIPVTISLIVSAFLLINVALGLFGVLNVSIARRRGEIGLRRAMGATAGNISRQFVGEMWVLATFALVPGLLLAMQFPLLNVFDLNASTYLTAMAISVLVIYLLVTLCAFFPSQQAATVQPAVALHEE